MAYTTTLVELAQNVSRLTDYAKHLRSTIGNFHYFSANPVVRDDEISDDPSIFFWEEEKTALRQAHANKLSAENDRNVILLAAAERKIVELADKLASAAKEGVE